MAKHLVVFRLKDMYAIKHSLQKVVKQKEQEIQFLQNNQVKDTKLKIEQLQSDVVHEQWLIQKMVNEIQEFKLYKGIS